MAKKIPESVKRLQRAFSTMKRAQDRAVEAGRITDKATHILNLRLATLKLAEAEYAKALEGLGKDPVPTRPSIRGVQMTDEEIGVAKTNKIMAIKMVRERSVKVLGPIEYLGLKEAKDLVDFTLGENPAY